MRLITWNIVGHQRSRTRILLTNETEWNPDAAQLSSVSAFLFTRFFWRGRITAGLLATSYSVDTLLLTLHFSSVGLISTHMMPYFKSLGVTLPVCKVLHQFPYTEGRH